MLLKQSTARVRMFKMIDSADHVSKKTGLSPTVNVSKNGGAFAAAAGAVAEVANGWYKVSLTTGDTDTLGDLAYYITATGADDTDFADQVVVDLPGGTVSSVTGSVGSVSAAVTVGTNNDKTGYSLTAGEHTNIGNDVWDTLRNSHTVANSFGAGVIVQTNNDKTGYTASTVQDKTGYSLAATGLDLVLIDTKTLPAALQYIAAACCGKLSGSQTSTEVFKGLDGTTTRLTVTADSSGNRTAITYS